MYEYHVRFELADLLKKFEDVKNGTAAIKTMQWQPVDSSTTFTMVSVISLLNSISSEKISQGIRDLLKFSRYDVNLAKPVVAPTCLLGNRHLDE